MKDDHSKPTPRQAQLLALLDQGVSNEQMAEQLGMKLATVKSHLHILYRRSNVRSRTQMLRIARERGWLQPDPDEATSLQGQRDALLRTLRDACGVLGMYATEDNRVREFLNRALDVITSAKRGTA
jgi:DNA-binding CsgD family transcriptional regulator